MKANIGQRRRKAILVSSWQHEYRRATAEFRKAEHHARRAEDLLNQEQRELPSEVLIEQQQAQLAQALDIAASTLAPGILSNDLHSLAPNTPIETSRATGIVNVRIGKGHPTATSAFSAIVPILGESHLVIDRDASDNRVAELLQSLLLRHLAAVPQLEIRLVDCVTLGQTFTPLAPIVKDGYIPSTATDLAGLDNVLSDAEERIHEAHRARNDESGLGDIPYRLIVIAGLPPQPSRALRARIAALAHAGPHGRLHLIIAGWRSESTMEELPALEHGRYITIDTHDRRHTVTGIPVPVSLDGTPPPNLTSAIYRSLNTQRSQESGIDIDTMLPQQLWSESSTHELSTIVGRDSRGPIELSFNDATPHWLIGGRTGGGKTVFLLNVLYGLASRYGPNELALYLLDFKEGVSFTEFTPSAYDETWIPQVKAVGVESDREYGNSVLHELRAEMNRRATAMKQVGVTKLSDLRQRQPDVAYPRILAVIDEFHVLFAGNDRLARIAVGHLEELARKGRSYGVHVILASQTTSGIEALYTKQDSIFGQFPMRIALPGAKHVLDSLNLAASKLTLGQAIANTSGGDTGFNQLLNFPDTTTESATTTLTALRRNLWQNREPTAPPPVVFAGYAEQHLTTDPTHRRTKPGDPPHARIGRVVDTQLSTMSFDMSPVPGRHLAVLGTTNNGADILHAAALSLAAAHAPGHAQFILTSLVPQAANIMSELASALASHNHDHKFVTAGDLAETIAQLNESMNHGAPTYLIVAGGDALSAQLAPAQMTSFRSLIKHGPGRGIHILGWWRGLRRFIDDIGSSNREDVAGLVFLNIPGTEIGSFIGDISNDYSPRANRVLAVDRHLNVTRLCVPFTHS